MKSWIDSYEPNGLTVMANIYGRILTITVIGETAQELATIDGYAAVGTISELSKYLQTSIVKYIHIS